jgi:hypothetical protein
MVLYLRYIFDFVSHLKVDPEIHRLLLSEEEILLTAFQSRGVPGGSITTPNAIYVTNIRVIFKDPRLFGFKATIIDYHYKDISNMWMKRGLFSTQIFLKSRRHSLEAKLPAVEKQMAEHVFMMIQKGIRGELPKQQFVKEKNSKEVDAKDESKYLKKLERLAELKDKKVITEVEFQLLKLEIMRGISSKGIQNSKDTTNLTSESDGNVPISSDKTASNPKLKLETCVETVPSASEVSISKETTNKIGVLRFTSD